ncbi:MAG TPA: Ig-like domain-containing protein [Terriglobales bacterium]|nr:Ig-like domain-containing protein [Terriglobales bacterium]
MVTASAMAQSATLSAWDLAFGQVAVGSSLSKTDTLTNTDTKALTIKSITAGGGAAWSQTNDCPATLAANAKCTLTVTFAPKATGGANGTVIIASNDPSGNQELDMTGTGLAAVAVSPTSLAFTAQVLNTSSAAKTATLTNNGAASLTVSGVSITGDYSQTNNCVGSLASKASCTISAVFKPTVAGARTGVISISDAAGTQTVSLTGTGTSTITLTSIAVTPNPSTVAAGATAQLTATGTYSDATTKDLTATATWTTSSAATATVAGGLVKGLKGATATITAASGTIRGTSALTVSKTITSIAVTPANVSIAAAATQQYVATATYSDATTAVVTSTVTWTSGTPAVATITAAGLARGVAGGTTAITATSGTAVGSTNLTVRALTSIAITPANVTIAQAATQQYVATGTYSDGSTAALTTVTWASGTTSIATISGSGLARGVAGGTAVIRATSGTIVGTTNLSVKALTSIAVTPANATLAAGLTLQYTATGTYSDATTANITATVTWSSATPATATITSAGLAKGVKAGTVAIRAVSGTITGTTNVTITKTLTSIAVTPANPTIATKATQQFTATGTYSDATTANLTATVTWASGTPAFATITTAGLATGVAPGVSAITATSGTVVGTTNATVTKVLSSIAVTPANVTIANPGTQQYAATATYSDATTADITSTVTWSATTTTFATINTTGLATTVSAGTTAINAKSGTITGTTNLTVSAATLSSIAVTPASITVGVGATQQYAALGTYSDSTTKDVTPQVTWTSGNPSVVGISTGGFATVQGTSTTAVAISATVGTVTSNPPAYVNALSSIARVCPNATVDMKVLIVTNSAANGGAGYVDFPAIKQILDYVGTPYTAMEYNAVTPDLLSDGACHGYYQGIIMAFANDIYSSTTLFNTLGSYEQTFHARQVNWFFNPTPDYGFNYSTSQIPSTQTYSANFTAAAATAFPNINISTPLSISQAFIYLSPLFTPPAGTVTPLLVDSSNNVMAAIYAPGNGQEILSQTFDTNQYLTHNLVLAYGLLNWVTKGVFLGDYHVYAAAQVDDFFINDAEWVPGTPCASATTHDRTPSDASFLGNFRLKNADMTSLVAWQNSLQSDPLLTGFKLSMAFNGVGTVGNKDWTGLAQSGVANDDLVSNVHAYEQFFHWMTHTYDHPNTLNGLHKSDTGGDPDNPPVDSIDLEILTNLYVASGTTQGGVNLDVDESDNPPNGAVTPLMFTDFNPANMVSPGVTGLNDPVVPTYLAANGIKYVVTDTSVVGQTNNGTNPSPNVGIVNSFAPTIYEVPRYPNNIFYNAANWADDQAEFYCIYGPVPGPAQPPYDSYNAAQILDYTSGIFVVNMLKGDMNPQMFHQPNLHFADNTAALGSLTPHVSSLISDTYDRTFQKYKALYKLPVLSLTLDQIAESMKARNAYNLSGATASLVGVGTATPTVSITVPAANPGAVIPVTGLTTVNGETYGGQHISHVQVNSGTTNTFPLQ